MWNYYLFIFKSTFFLNISLKTINVKNKKLPVKKPDPLIKICVHNIEIIKHFDCKLFLIIFLQKKK